MASSVCSLCLDNFNDPRLLSCSHTYCRDCLKSYLITSVGSDCPGTKFDCPLCRREVVLPAYGVEGIQKNYYLPEPSTQGSKSNYQLCAEHPDEDLRFYCRKCDVMICRDCKVVSHEGHKTDMVKNVISELKLKIENILDVAENDIRENEKKLRVCIESEIDDLKKSVTAPKQMVETMKDEIDSVFRILTDSVNPYLESKNASLTIIGEWAEKRHRRLSECRTLLSQGLNCKEDSMVTIKVLKELVDNEDGIKQIKEPPSLPEAKSSGYFDENLLETELLRFTETIKQATQEFKNRITCNYYCLFSESITSPKEDCSNALDEQQDEGPLRKEFRATPDYWEEHLVNDLGTKTSVTEIGKGFNQGSEYFSVVWDP